MPNCILNKVYYIYSVYLFRPVFNYLSSLNQIIIDSNERYSMNTAGGAVVSF